ncbi:hypothetical protein [Microbacterium marinilacus]|uniref:Uncharacterized protein n=1 Tax=Microbacterium marinilacus TaxID=415209 RepID=A0ABP7BET9_9MICO|nr:hypothetical protein [Microbacterium marinilacus]MBY0689315.1 hypothetical protein [Microbacterium marinilacus]
MSSTPERSIDHAKEGRAIRFGTIDEALVRYGTPVGNLELVRGLAAAVGPAALIGFRTYFKIERSGGGPALEVHDGYTTGFRSEADAQRLAGDRPRWESRRFRGAWGVTHPETRHRPLADRPKRASTSRSSAPRAAAAPRSGASEPREGQVCMTCFMQMPLTGVCPNCG